MTAGDNDGETAAQYRSQPVLAEWLTAVSTWSQLQVAAGCRLHKDAAIALRQGLLDPDDPAKTSIKEILAATATANAELAALPWQNGARICKSTTRLVADATQGWSRASHWLHHSKVREAVFTVLVVALRLDKKDARAALTAASASSSSSASASAPASTSNGDLSDASCAEQKIKKGGSREGNAVPVLPIEMWTFMMRFFMRSWWKV